MDKPEGSGAEFVATKNGDNEYKRDQNDQRSQHKVDSNYPGRTVGERAFSDKDRSHRHCADFTNLFKSHAVSLP